MRTTPTLSVSDVGNFVVNDTGATPDTTNIATSVVSPRSATIAATVAAGLTDGQGSQIQFDATAGGFVQGTAEL